MVGNAEPHSTAVAAIEAQGIAARGSVATGNSTKSVEMEPIRRTLAYRTAAGELPGQAA